MSNEFYKSTYIPKNPSKYIGDINKITARSSWERFVMLWADSNPDIIGWGSEVTVIAYKCGTDGLMHKYYVDFTFKFNNGKTLLVEVKPKKQTQTPKKSKGKSKKTMLNEQLTFIKNVSKWKYAIEFSKRLGVSFEIWTEETLSKMGFKVL